MSDYARIVFFLLLITRPCEDCPVDFQLCWANPVRLTHRLLHCNPFRTQATGRVDVQFRPISPVVYIPAAKGIADAGSLCRKGQ